MITTRAALSIGLHTTALALTGTTALAQTTATLDALPAGTGAFPAIYERREDLPAHVVYRPQDLGELGDERLGIYVYGNGGCSSDGTSSKHHLLEIASHGYLAIALGTIPSQDTTAQQAALNEGGQLVAATPVEAFREAIEWAISENRRPESLLHGRIAEDQLAVSGWSCGGLQALFAAGDSRVKTSVIMYSGIFNENRNPIQGLEVDKAMLDQLNGSVLYVLGGPDDIAYPNGTDDFRRISGRPAALVNIPVGHGGTFNEPNGGLGAQVVVDWLDWQLKGRSQPAQLFEGRACGYCDDPRLTIETKDFE